MPRIDTVGNKEGRMLQVVDRPGYFGRKRTKKVEFYDNLFGEGKWSECWEIDGKIVPFEKAVELYDAAYYELLSRQPETVDWIVSFGECYDSDPSNIQCGCEHDPNSSPRHMQDISIRRALKKLGVWFKGTPDNLLWIRGPESNGFQLNPGNVPFHRPDLILSHGGPKPNWAKEASVEHFWQANKVIIVEGQPQYS